MFETKTVFLKKKMFNRNANKENTRQMGMRNMEEGGNNSQRDSTSDESPGQVVLKLRTPTSQKCEAVPRRARV